ncbi:sensor histidine kinase, partial [Blautia producta]|nr:sensor histidine kinase [Blautia producta]
MERVKSVMRHHEQVLKEENRRKSDLLTYLAHDLKTPLTSVMGYLSLLNEAPDMPEAQKEKYVGFAFDKACRLESLLNEFF